MQQVLRWFPIAWAAGAYVTLPTLPIYGVVRDAQTAAGAEFRNAGRATLVAVNGPGVYLLLAIPLLAAALPVLPWPARLQRSAATAGVAIACAFVVLGMASVGLFFLPCPLALFRSRRDPGHQRWATAPHRTKSLPTRP